MRLMVRKASTFSLKHPQLKIMSNTLSISCATLLTDYKFPSPYLFQLRVKNERLAVCLFLTVPTSDLSAEAFDLESVDLLLGEVTGGGDESRFSGSVGGASKSIISSDSINSFQLFRFGS